MKRRAISFLTVLALCLSLCPTWVLAADWGPEDVLYSTGMPTVIANSLPSAKYVVSSDTTIPGPYDITKPMVFDTGGHSYTASDAATLRVTKTGELYLTTGKIESKNGFGIDVQSGGFLCVANAGMVVIGTTYALNIPSGAKAQLSGGTFTGGTAAIQTQDYGALLEDGCAFFDKSGNPIRLYDANGNQTKTEVAGKTTVVVRECTDHGYSYTGNTGALTHNGICVYCGKKVNNVLCSFSFDKNGSAACEDKNGSAACEDKCGHTLTITVNPNKAVYDGTSKPDNDPVTVKLNGSKLTKDVNYTVDYSPITDVGETLITVRSKTSQWDDYKTTFRVKQAEPVITWQGDIDDPIIDDPMIEVGYTGNPVDKNELPKVKITGIPDSDQEELKQLLYFSYKKISDNSSAGFTGGRPTDVGTYKIRANLPETTNYVKTHSDEITLTIIQLNSIIKEAPRALRPVYNGTEQKLVTGGILNPNAVGAVILFATSEDGPWSTDIPTGINAGNDYRVYYKVEGTDNYKGIEPEKVEDVGIERKPVTLDVKLEYYTCVYDGGYKQPGVTVIDAEDGTVLPDSEYKVTYWDNQAVGKAKVTISDKSGGNYAIPAPENPKFTRPEGSDIPNGVDVAFDITPKDQDALSITGQPNKIEYGDVFTLGTVGGSGNGTVTWKIIAGENDVATVVSTSGQVKVTGVGTATVEATKSDTDTSGNHKDATATWTFTSVKKPITASVTAASKTYDGKATTTVDAVAEQGVVPGDTIKITGLTGTFRDANAGINKIVDVTGTPVITVNDATNEKYIVTIPTTTTADIAKVVSRIVTPPTPARPTYSGEPQDLLAENGEAVPNNRKNIQVEYALSENGSYSMSIPKATNAGTYEVWYRAQESTNYTAIPAAMVTATIAPKSVTADVTLDENSYQYDGSAKEPAVTVKYTESGESKTIPPSNYTVTYSNNVNVGNATVTVTAKADGNYTFDNSGPVTATFTITKGSKAVLTSSPLAKDLTYNGQEQDLVTVGTATGGKLVYSLDNENNYKESIPKGTDAKTYTVYYKVKGDGNYEDSDVSHVFVTIQPKTVTSPTITLASDSFVYSGQKQKPGVTSVVDGTDTIPVNEYTVSYSNNINAGTATVHISDNNGGNYNVSGSKTFEITKAAATFTTAPAAKPNLTYNATAQPLITAGVPEGGTAVYSLGDKNGPYSTAIPTGTDRGSYNVWAMVRGDANHTDSTAQQIANVKIDVNSVNALTVELSPASFRYNGSAQRPAVTVKDDSGYVIPANEYTVTYEKVIVSSAPDTPDTKVSVAPEDIVDASKYYVVIKCKSGGNYSFGDKECPFTIAEADQAALTITGKPNVVYYGDILQLGTTGGSGSGAVVWSITAGDAYIKKGQNDGQFEIIKKGGPITITATRTSDTGNYAASEDTWTFYAYPKPVAAVVTAADKVYNGDQDAVLSVAAPGTGIQIAVKDGVKGAFDTSDVGTGKTVTFTVGSEDVTVQNNNENYEIVYPGSGTTTASIRPADVDLKDKALPTENTLEYNGSAQALVAGGASLDGGTWVYSLDGVSYDRSIPKGTNAGEYSVWYKVLADSNHKDTTPTKLTVKITQKEVNVTVKCSPDKFPYDGTEKTPNVIVTYSENGSEKVVPANEYTVEFSEERIEVKNGYKVTVKSNGNYKFTNDAMGTFNIIPASQAPLTIVTDKAPVVYYGETFRLSAVGGSGTGTINWSIECIPGGVAEITADGVVTVKGVGRFTVSAYRAGTNGSYSESNTDSKTFQAQPKPVTAVVTAEEMVYDKNRIKDAELDLSAFVPSNTGLAITNVKGKLTDVNVGSNIPVEIISWTAIGNDNGYYDINVPETTTVTIKPAPTFLDGITVTAETGLTYNGKEQELVAVTAPVTIDGGSLAYSLNGGRYSTDLPKAENAGDYTVRYKVLGDSNHTDSEVMTVPVKIEKATPVIKSATAAIETGHTLLGRDVKVEAIYEGGDVPGTVSLGDNEAKNTYNKHGTHFLTTPSAEFMPNDTKNFVSGIRVGTITITVTGEDIGDTDVDIASLEPTPGSTISISSADKTSEGSISSSVRNGTAISILDTAASNELVNKAIANQSKNVVIKPEVAGDVTKAEVSIPASAVSRIGNETDAALTVSTPIADVTIPNSALDRLSSAGSAVSVVTEQVENSIVLTLTADGKNIGDIPGGLTLTVPVENAGPGTVAVLVYEDGTRETVRRSVAEGGAVRIPLNGSVTLEIVDNSKEFTDVPAESWAADAVAFASAHEIFNGTGEATFSPERSMSRAMLATVLYNLDGCPDQEVTSAFSDVNSDDWYAAGILWAAENGITSGYGDGQFGPDDSITREQLAVMLWRYMGSPAADEQIPSFTDTAQASGYAVEALYWAATNGILNGYGNGQLDPCGLATRAQAAQMLKNFIENT